MWSKKGYCSQIIAVSWILKNIFSLSSPWWFKLKEFWKAFQYGQCWVWTGNCGLLWKRYASILLWKVRHRNHKRRCYVFSRQYQVGTFFCELVIYGLKELRRNCYVSYQTSKICYLFLHIGCKKSFVGKFAWGKNMFCRILRKVDNRSRSKLKLDIRHLKKYLIWNFHLVWPAQFREWSVYKYPVLLFIIRFRN